MTEGQNSKQGLWKTTLVIWSPYNPTQENRELSDLARDAEVGESYCSQSITEYVLFPKLDPEWDDTEFFDVELDEEYEEFDPE